MNIVLRDYQRPFYDNIINELYTNNVNRLCCVLPTGGGKSIIIGKLAKSLPGRTLILTHRIEILKQNSDWLINAGVLSSKENTLRYDNTIVIAMVQTLYARIEKYGIDYLGHFDNIILDEVHILIFEKVFAQYNFTKLIGFTGSPVIHGKNIYTEIDGVEYVEPYTLSKIFNKIVCGPDSQDLIDLGYLVQDFNITLKLPDFDKLRESKTNPDGYTSKSMNEVYYNTVSLSKLDEAYYKYAKSKKTLIFNSSNKVNKFVYDHMKKKGLNVKMFDTSENREFNEATGKKYKREEIIEWFRNERDAILINTNVFTTGFDVPDVEVVVVNRATKSLALWIQMIGRGSRITDKIYKDKFTVIDLGQNIYEHGRWSKKRDWRKWFFSDGPKLKNNRDMLATWECEYCGSLNIKGEIICDFCGAEKLDAVVDGKTKKFKEGELSIVQDMPPPRGNFIVKYCLAHDKDISFALKLVKVKILELFTHYNVSDEFYARRKLDYVDSNGKHKDGFDTRVSKMFRPCYFAIMSGKNGLTGNRRRKYRTELNRVIKAVETKMNYNG
jgi:superfamily II DNA or RNA helicase